MLKKIIYTPLTKNSQIIVNGDFNVLYNIFDFKIHDFNGFIRHSNCDPSLKLNTYIDWTRADINYCKSTYIMYYIIRVKTYIRKHRKFRRKCNTFFSSIFFQCRTNDKQILYHPNDSWEISCRYSLVNLEINFHFEGKMKLRHIENVSASFICNNYRVYLGTYLNTIYILCL